jgi:hypothetical protein
MPPLVDLPICHFEINAPIVGPSNVTPFCKDSVSHVYDIITVDKRRALYWYIQDEDSSTKTSNYLVSINQCPHCWTFQYVILRSMTPLLDLPVCHFEINAPIVGPSNMSFWNQCLHCWDFPYVIFRSMSWQNMVLFMSWWPNYACDLRKYAIEKNKTCISNLACMTCYRK